MEKTKVKDYATQNSVYWQGRYLAPNVESFIFRFYGRILRHDYGIDGSNNEKILDFGCGEGGALRFFDSLGFNCYGVDIAENDLKVARKVMPKRAEHIKLISPVPKAGIRYADDDVDIAISIQTLDFLSNSDFSIVIKNIYNNMKPGGKIYASMNGWNMYYRNHANYAGDGLWHVEFNNGRVEYDVHLNFVKDRDEMREKFSLFKPIYIDYYDSSFREEGSEFRHTFFGIKE
jgi:SAM-dependent methyltransferase